MDEKPPDIKKDTFVLLKEKNCCFQNEICGCIHTYVSIDKNAEADRIPKK